MVQSSVRPAPVLAIGVIDQGGTEGCRVESAGFDARAASDRVPGRADPAREPSKPFRC